MRPRNILIYEEWYAKTLLQQAAAKLVNETSIKSRGFGSFSEQPPPFLLWPKVIANGVHGCCEWLIGKELAQRQEK